MQPTSTEHQFTPARIGVMTSDGYEVTGEERTCGHAASILHRLVLEGPDEEVLLCCDCAIEVGLITREEGAW